MPAFTRGGPALIKNYWCPKRVFLIFIEREQLSLKFFEKLKKTIESKRILLDYPRRGRLNYCAFEVH